MERRVAQSPAAALSPSADGSDSNEHSRRTAAVSATGAGDAGAGGGDTAAISTSAAIVVPDQRQSPRETANGGMDAQEAATAAPSSPGGGGGESFMSSRLANNSKHSTSAAASSLSSSQHYIQLATQAFLRVSRFSRNFRRFSPVWTLLGSLLLAYLFPSALSVSAANWLLQFLIPALFFSIGATAPLREWSGIISFRLPHLAVLSVSQFVLAPIMTALVFFVFSSVHSGSAGGLARTMASAAAACLPPSPSTAASVTAVAGGSDSLSFLSGTLLNSLGLIVVPFISQLSVHAASTEQLQTAPGKDLGVHLRESSQLISYLVLSTLLPLGMGCGLQVILFTVFGGSSGSTNTNNNIVSGGKSPDAVSTPTSPEGEVASNNTNQQPQKQQLFDSGEYDDSIVVCFGIRLSRSKARRAVGVISFALRYCCFLLMFADGGAATTATATPSSPSSAVIISWPELGKTMLLSMVIALLNTLISWFFISRIATVLQQQNTNNNSSAVHVGGGGGGPMSPMQHHQSLIDDRVAIFLTSFTKSDLLIVPIFSQLFVSSIDGRVVVLMSHAFVFCFAHLLVAALLAVSPLAEWRRRQLCRPGASLLPRKFGNVPPYQHMLAPAAGTAMHFTHASPRQTNISGGGIGVAGSLSSSAGGGASDLHVGSPGAVNSLVKSAAAMIKNPSSLISSHGRAGKSEANKA